MDRKSTTFFLLFLFLSLYALASTYAVSGSVVDNETADVQVDQISHTISFLEGNLVIVNETLKMSPKGENGALLRDFSLGFPFRYVSNLDYSFAHETSNPDARFEVELDAGLGHPGFYGVNVVFPEQGLNLISGESYHLTVIFIFSNLISSQTMTYYDLDFPMYPSLTQEASLCNVTMILPDYLVVKNSTFHNKKLDFEINYKVNTPILTHSISPLDSFAYEPGWLNFWLERPEVQPRFSVVEVNEIKREIDLDQWGTFLISDSYHITNRRPALQNILLTLPEGAHAIHLRDEFGDFSPVFEGNGSVRLIFRNVLNKDQQKKFTFTYRLPSIEYVSQNDGLDYELASNFFEHFNWTIRKLTVTVTLPQGAKFELSDSEEPYTIKKSVFQETMTFTLFDVTPFHDLFFNLEYEYSIFWASFHPTIWMGVLIIISSIIAILWKTPKSVTVPIVQVPLEDLRSFIEIYESKTTILLDLESMEEQLRKRKISRRRYKMRKKMLEGRLSSRNRDLSSLQEKIGKAGYKYAELIGQIEVAEAMLEGVETDIRRIEVRYRRGEISKGAYNRLLEDYHRRMERAKTTIDGIILRLKAEIR